MKVKICGLRDPQNIREIAELHPGYMGFIFYPPSPRCCLSLPESVVRELPDDIIPVAVTVNMEFDGIMAAVRKYGFRGVQLHGDESPELCDRLREKRLFVLKAISIKDAESVGNAAVYDGHVDLLVLDTATKSKGGSGRKFDWSLLHDANINTDFLLSGGIGPEDVVTLRNLQLPRMVGVDLNSRFETSPGVKSVDLISEFLSQLNCNSR